MSSIFLQNCADLSLPPSPLKTRPSQSARTSNRFYTNRASSLDSVTHSRSPGLSSTAFPTQPPNSHPGYWIDMEFTASVRLSIYRMSPIRCFCGDSYVCYTLQLKCALLSLHLNLETAVGRCVLPEAIDSKWEFDCSAATQWVSGLKTPGTLISGLWTCLGHCNYRE